MGAGALPLLALVTLSAAPAGAHPHAWIDLRSKVTLNADGEVSGLELYWLFDEWYTIYIADELTKSGLTSTEYLTSLAQENLANLAEYDYFTKVTVNGDPVETGEVTAFETGLSDERLWLKFDVPLAQPVDPHAGYVSYMIYDPTYYIEVLHQEEEPVTFEGPGAERCRGTITAPNPTFDAMALASALDVTQSAGDGLGEVFAETVDVTCR
jgi:ABC-type uncharacterized transport system substrate-binding protein